MTIIFAVAKFALGAWLIVIIIPLLVGAMLLVGRQYRRRRVENEVREESVIGPPRRHQRVIVPASDVTRDVVQAIRFGRTMSDDVTAVHVTDDVEARRADPRRGSSGSSRACPLVIVESPYRSLVRPLVRYLEDAAEDARRRRRGRAAARVRAAPLVGAASSTTRTAGGSSEALLGRPNILVAEVPYRREL